MTTSPVFTVTLHHLAPDVKKAGVEYPDVEITLATGDRLRGIIAALSKLAATDHHPARPELRIVAPHGRFVILASEGRLRFNSWSVRVGGADLSPDQIFAIVTGADDPGAVAMAAESFVNDVRRSRRWKVALMAVVIVGTNATTAWMLLRPPPSNPLLAEYKLLAPEPAERLFAGVAGEYQTGATAGDRGMKIARDGRLHWVKFGPKGSVVEESDLTAKAAESRGHPALFTSRDSLIDILDTTTVMFYGDTYRRKFP
jgi:hypothetical protein